MSGFHFESESDAWLTITALKTASEVFTDHAESMKAAGQARLERQFRDQSSRANAIAVQIEEKI